MKLKKKKISENPEMFELMFKIIKIIMIFNPSIIFILMCIYEVKSLKIPESVASYWFRILNKAYCLMRGVKIGVLKIFLSL